MKKVLAIAICSGALLWCGCGGPEPVKQRDHAKALETRNQIKPSVDKATTELNNVVPTVDQYSNVE